MQISNGLQFKPWHIFFFIVIFTPAFGALWEIWEFTLNSLAGAYLTEPLQQNNTDTMLDLIADLDGGILIAILGTLYLKRKCACNWADILLEPGFEKIAVHFQR